MHIILLLSTLLFTLVEVIQHTVTQLLYQDDRFYACACTDTVNYSFDGPYNLCEVAFFPKKTFFAAQEVLCFLQQPHQLIWNE